MSGEAENIINQCNAQEHLSWVALAKHRDGRALLMTGVMEVKVGVVYDIVR